MIDQKEQVKFPNVSIAKILFDYYSRGFFHSSFNFNGETTEFKTEEEAKEKIKWLKENFNKVLIEKWDSHSDVFKDKRNTLEPNKQFDNGSLKTQINYQELSSTELTVCPLCKKKIYRKDINFQEINKTEIENYPFPYIYFHSYLDFPPHVLIMYLDSDLRVRGKKATKYFVIEW